MTALAELLQEPGPDLREKIRTGIPTDILDQIATSVGMSINVLGEKLRIPRRTLTRKRSQHKPLSADESEKVLRLARIFGLARDLLFTSDEAVADWLSRPDPALGQCAPIDILDTEVGAREVEDLILSIAHGQSA